MALSLDAPIPTVLLSPSSINARRKTYQKLSHVRVLPLQLAPCDINASRLISLMGLHDEVKVPLYMTSILMILREQGLDGFSCKLYFYFTRHFLY